MTPLSGVLGAGVGEAVNALGLAGGIGRMVSGVGGLYASAMIDRMNVPLQEHPGDIYKGLLQRAASGYYD